MDLETFGISVITDIGDEDNIDTISHDEVLEAAQKAEPNVRSLIKDFEVLVSFRLRAITA
jgi:purine-nucleoside phosphorylase